ncbi:DUF3947 family protein [Bacillus cereus group sp. BfR-BA-01380]|uniref:DUF3947 family protein n=1 Tax=Bacillus cereus group sp. BfR-BA-01380 TaxID=2920324 RepID=UPI001F59395A|nr:DUF3947 family protein [Bacillus cereus group sp. BfR-BA-01380]
MINPYFHNTRQLGAATTYSSAQQTLHAIHQVMATEPFFLHSVHYPVTHHYVVPHHIIHHVIYPTDISTIPFGSTYYF